MSLWNIGYLIVGVYVGQEYGKQLPNVKIEATKLFDEFQKSDLYKNLTKKNK